MTNSIDVIVNPTTLRLRADALFPDQDAIEEQLRGAATLIEMLKSELILAQAASTSPPVKYHLERIKSLNRELKLSKELARQFGTSDAEIFALAPHKYAHRFDARTLAAYNKVQS